VITLDKKQNCRYNNGSRLILSEIKKGGSMKKGFTLIELIVVIAIIAVMGAVIAPNAFKSIEKAKIAATVQDLNSIKTAAGAYFTDMSAWPTSSGNFTTGPAGTAWDGPYLDKWPEGNRWPGAVYTWNIGTNGVFNAGSTAQERYISLTNLGAGVAGKLEAQIDPGNTNATGVAHSTATTIDFLVSRDGPVN
jgi:general secretion pathway protein G